MTVTVTTTPPGVFPKTTTTVSDADYAAVKASILREKSGDLLALIDEQDKADLATKAAYTAPKVTAWTGDIEEPEGDNAVFTVTATASPSPEYRWYLTMPGGGSRTKQASVTNTLTLTAVTLAYDGAVIECEVRNHRGTVTKTATLTVTEGE